MSTKTSYVTLTDTNFQQEVLDSDQLVLVDFWAAWCGPCRVVGPVVEELASEYEGRAKIGKLNVDENQQIAGSLGIRGIPALFFFKNGKVVDEVVGAVPKQLLVSKLDEHLAN